MASEPSGIPRGMGRVYRRFAHWRNAHPGVRLPIPARLWKAAVKVAREQGVCRTAQVLRLEYGKLKRIVESGQFPIHLHARKGRGVRRSAAPRSAVAEVAATKARRARSAAPLPSFLELVGSPVIGGSECLIELEGPQGKMRVQWKGTGTPDLAALGRVLLESRAR